LQRGIDLIIAGGKHVLLLMLESKQGLSCVAKRMAPCLFFSSKKTPTLHPHKVSKIFVAII